MNAVSAVRDHVSCKIFMLAVGGSGYVYTPPSSHCSCPIRSISVVQSMSAAGLTIAWQHRSGMMELW